LHLERLSCPSTPPRCGGSRISRGSPSPHLQGELNAILAFVEQLDEVDVAGVEPMTSVTPMVMKKREDRVTDGEMAERIVANAPASEDNYFLVPKVVE
jgi:aspartyl-tRNA(Asn)/glutamyl-tRNA(Gln) amidotransferase subunit C